MKSFTLNLLSIHLICLTLSHADAAILAVPDDFQTIQDGIDNAQDGDTVLVSQGVYEENISFNGRNITVGSHFILTGEAFFITSTIIDGGGNASVALFRGGENEQAILSGFTLRNGASNYGAGVYINGSSPTLDHLVITANHAVRDGGGIYCTHNANPILNHLTVAADSADRGNSGLHAYDNSSATIINSIFWGNIPETISAGQSITYSDIEGGYNGQGNIDVDPEFTDLANGDLTLTANSPCIDAGDANTPDDPDETQADLGALYFNQSPSPFIFVMVDTLDFGNIRVDDEVSLPVGIVNLGDADLTVSHPYTDGEIFHADNDEWDQVVLAPGDSLDVDAFFHPTESGEFFGHFFIPSDDPDHDTLDVVLFGIGAVPAIVIAPDTIDFEEVLIGDSSLFQPIIRNWGGFDLTVNDATVDGQYFSVNFGGSFVLGAGEAVTIDVVFTPQEVQDSEGTLTVFSDDPANPEMVVPLYGTGRSSSILELGWIDTPGLASSVALFEDFAYVADGGSGIRIINIANPENPQEVGNIDLDGIVNSVIYDTNYIYAAVGENGIAVVDISDPANPEVLATLDTPGNAEDLAQYGFQLFVADGDGGLRIIDITTPDSPQEIGYTETDGSAEGISVYHGKAFVAMADQGLGIFDISDLENPQSLGSIHSRDRAVSVTVRGDLAYVADGDAGLTIIDVSSPNEPQIIANFDTQSTTTDIVLQGDFAFIANSTSGIVALDIRDPENLGSGIIFDTPETALGITVRGRDCFAADGEGGLIILNVDDLANYPKFEISSISVDPGKMVVDHRVTKSLTLRNRGTRPLEVMDIIVTEEAFGTNFGGPQLIEPGNSLEVVIEFAPTEAGDYSASMLIISDDPFSTQQRVDLAGIGIEFRITEEQGSLQEFFAGQEEGCEYDNWVSHISEGIARAGFNEYGPVELDRPTNGFGSYVMIDSLPNSEAIINSWYTIFTELYQNNVDEALVAFAISDFAGMYEMVRLEDGEKTYIMFRERLNNDYFDDNGTQDEADDVTGSFDLGWGLFVFDLDPYSPNIIIEVPHPEDDYLAPHSGIDALVTIGAKAFIVGGANRETLWTNEGQYTNSKSLSDPTRTINNPFNQAHKAAVDHIDNEFVIQVHSYDTEAHPDLLPVEVSTRLDYYPNRPVLDFENHFDIISLTPEYPIAANSSGHEDHDSVRVDEYYAVWYDIDVMGSYQYHNRYEISNELTMFSSSWNQQMLYSMIDHDTLTDDEHWFHIEEDELPNVINEDILDYYSVGGEVTYHNYEPAVEFYHPIYVAIRDYFHHNNLHNVPADYQTIQAAVNASVNGDTVLVQPGTYVENVNFNGRNVVLGSLFLTTGDPAYIDSTIIDGNRNGSVVRFDSGESNEARLIGFTLRNGSGSINAENDISGGGVHCHNASPGLSYLKIIDNNAWYAAGIYTELGSDAIIDHCLITGNTAAIAGGGMDSYASDPTLTNCTIVNNSALRGGGLYLFDGCNLSISNTIFWSNFPQEILYSLSGAPDSITFNYCDVMGGARHIDTRHNGGIVWGTGNFDLDPEFNDADNIDFSLADTSPCRDAGDPTVEREADGSWIDVGAISSPYEIAQQPRALVSTLAIDFGTAEAGQDAIRDLTVRNTGYTTLTLSQADLSGDNSADFAVDFNQQLGIEPGELAVIRLTFNSEEDGRRNATLSIMTDDPDRNEVVVELSGYLHNRHNLHSWLVPDDFETIQQAVDYSVDGDTVLVRNGTYHENIDFNGKSITLASLYLLDLSNESIVATTIAGDYSGGVISFVSGEDENSTIVGFTITGGLDGIYCGGSSPVIRKCIVTNNNAVNSGGAGLYCRDGASPQVINCTIADNSARWGGGGYIQEGSGATFINSIVWNNSDNSIFASGSGAENQLSVAFSNLEGGQQGIVTNNNCQVTCGNGNIADDPLFRDPDNGDYHLTENSPCIDSGDDNSLPDADSTRADIGALYYDQAAPRIAVDPEILEFQITRAGEQSNLDLTISNIGIEDLAIQDIATEGEFFGVDFNDNIVLTPDESTTITVSFIPGRRGIFEGLLIITSNDPDNVELTVPLSGIGENDPPEVISAIGDLSFEEDSGTWIIADLDTVFGDPNGDELTYEIVAPDSLTATINEENVLTIESPDNFNGDGLEFVVSASDGPNRQRHAGAVRTLRGTFASIVEPQRSRNLRAVGEQSVQSSFLQSSLSTQTTPDGFILRDGSVENAFTLTIEPVNDPPFFTDMPDDISIMAGDLIEFQIAGTDPDVGDDVAISLIQDDGTLDRGAEFIDNGDMTATYTWQTARDVGEYRLVFQLSDAQGETDLAEVWMEVIDGNRPPEVGNEIGDIEVDEDTGPWEIAELNQIFFDRNDDLLTFSVEAPEPLSAIIDEETSLLTISAPENYNCESTEIVVTADDGHGGQARMGMRSLRSATLSSPSSPRRALRTTSAAAPVRDDLAEDMFLLTINPINDAPVWIERPPDPFEVSEGDTIRFNLATSDPDTDQVTIFMGQSNLPQQVNFTDNDDGTASFEWATSFTSAGNYSAIIGVSDGIELTNFELFIDVLNINRPPQVVDSLGDVTVNEDCGRTVIADLRTVFQDDADEVLTYEFVGAAAEVGMGIIGDTLIILPDVHYNHVTPQHIRVTATDSSAESAYSEFDLVINAVNYPPNTFALTSPEDGIRVNRGNYQIEYVWQNAVDVDPEDTLRYRVQFHIVHLQLDTTVSTGYIDSQPMTIAMDTVLSNLGIESDDLILIPLTWWVEAFDGHASRRSVERWQMVVEAPLGMDSETISAEEFKLVSVLPNPFNSTTVITFTAGLSAESVKLEIYDISGRLAANLLDGMDGLSNSAGEQKVVWNAGSMTAGVYFIRLASSEGVRTAKVMLVR